MSPEEIKLLRQSLDISQREFARLLDVSHATIQNWESGRTRPQKMKVDLMRDLRRKAQKEKERGGDVQEFLEGLLALAAGGAFGLMLGKIYSDLSNDSDDEQ